MLSICAIVRNEAPYITEWIAFHRLVGVSQFYIYDDRSDDETMQILNRLSLGDICVLPYESGWHEPLYYGIPYEGVQFYLTPQACAYRHCACHFGVEMEWCAFVDVDEFLYHTEVDNLAEFLNPFSSYPGVVANWMVFGSNGHQTRPAQLTIEAYTKRGEVGQPHPWGRHIKTIVNMRFAHQWGQNGSHLPLFEEGRAVDQYTHPHTASMMEKPYQSGLLVNHYYHRSAQEAESKWTREDHNAPKGFKQSKERVKAHDVNDVEDLRILRFLPKLNQALA
jgi:hypothetical protein